MSSPVFDALIVGCGAIAGGYDHADPRSTDVLTHAKAYGLHDGFRAVACVEPDAQKRRAFQDRWEIPHGFAALDQVDVPFSVASCCVPTAFHAETLRALLARRPRLVWAEKPVTDDLDSAEQVVAAYDRAGISLCVNHLRRWAPGIVALKAEIAAGQWGNLQGGTGIYTKGLLNNGSHMLDLLAFLLGPVQPVACVQDVDEGRDDDTARTVIVAVDRAQIHVQGFDGRAFTVFELDLLFTGGRVTLTDAAFTVVRRPVEASAKFPGYQVLAAPSAQPAGLERAMLATLDNVHAHLTAGQDLASTGHTALAAQRLCAALSVLPAAFPRRM